MSDIVLRVENLHKRYRLGLVNHAAFRDDLRMLWSMLRGKPKPADTYVTTNELVRGVDAKKPPKYIWALQGVDFEVKRGDILGIIGKNGAGKSTLLKILSKTTAPTKGSVKVKGRIASLLEVGTGFHPELTGRENIYLNGMILGMKKREIDRKLDEIVDFAGVETYLDTPTKRYSSGMTVRLGFAVAAHLEPEILVVDEVLAVGDAEFQKKAIGKMQEVSKGEGRTVLFVSHNMASVKTLCTRAVVLENGQFVMNDIPENAISYYLTGGGDLMNRKTFNYENPQFRLHSIQLNNKGEHFEQPLIESKEIELSTDVTIKKEGVYNITYHLHNEMGEALFSFSDGRANVFLEKGRNKSTCFFPANFFQPGEFYLSLFIVKDKRDGVFVEKDIIAFNIVDGDRELGAYMGREPGYIKPKFEWKNEIIDD